MLIGEAIQTGAHRIRKAIHWNVVQLTEDGELEWGQYDEIIESIVKQGAEPTISFGRTPRWASNYEDECDGTAAKTTICKGKSACNRPPTAWPPKNDDAWRAWRNFVFELAARYGDSVKFYEPRAEPDSCHSWSGTVEQYVKLRELAYEAIHSADSDAVVYGPSVIPGQSEYWEDYLVACLDEMERGNKLFDVLSLHVFEDSPVEMVEQIRNVKELIRSRDLDPDSIPIAVTSAQTWAVDLTGIWNVTLGQPEHRYCPYFCPCLDEDGTPQIPCEWHTEYRDEEEIRVTDLPQLPCDTEEVQARTLTDIYACLANEGVQSVSWFQLTDSLTIWDELYCPPDGIARTGILSHKNDEPPYRRKRAFEALKAISAYVDAVNR